MKKYSFEWRDVRTLYLEISANSREEAIKKFDDGDYDDSKIEVEDEDILDSPETLYSNVKEVGK